MWKHHIVQFLVMIFVGMAFNPMNILAYRFQDVYVSTTLFYGGILMASNMVWAHEIVHFLAGGRGNLAVFAIGVVLSISVSVGLLRQQLGVKDTQWLRRMISHHSTALTTSHKIYRRTHNPEIRKLARDILTTQEQEITLMKSLLGH